MSVLRTLFIFPAFSLCVACEIPSHATVKINRIFVNHPFVYFDECLCDEKEEKKKNSVYYCSCVSEWGSFEQ